MKKVIIWSILGCPACRNAKMFLMQKNMEYEERIVGDKWTKEDFNKAVPNVKTYPQIFIDDKHIGGWSDLLEYSKHNEI